MIQTPTTITVRTENGRLVSQYNSRFLPSAGDVIRLITNDDEFISFVVVRTVHIVREEGTVTAEFQSVTVVVAYRGTTEKADGGRANDQE